jgi:hypothetical protein
MKNFMLDEKLGEIKPENPSSSNTPSLIDEK